MAKIFASSQALRGHRFRNPVVVIGNFDGVHRGHQALLRATLQKAKKIHGTVVVYTLFPHPSHILHPTTPTPQMTSLQTRLKLMEHQKIPVIVVEKFTRAFSKKSAQQFFKEVVIQNLRAKELFVGYNFSFGKDREGNIDILKHLCKKNGIVLHVFPPFKVAHEIVSSSKIRTLIQAGNIEKANAFLGRSYVVNGKVIQGEGRGQKLEAPTANLEVKTQLLPKAGVYLTRVCYQHKFYPSVTHVGPAPTFRKGRFSSFETHILNFNQTLYGKNLTLHFVDRLRNARKFKSVQALVTQIQKDIKTAKKRLFSSEKNSPYGDII